MFNRSGQESAPFELLVAVIIMGFVIFFGLQAMQELEKQQCIAKADKKLEELRTGLEQTVGLNASPQIDFIFEGCFQNYEVQLRQVANTSLCSRICKGAKELCVFLEFESESPSYSDRKCVNIAYLTNFERTDSGAECVQGFEKVNPYDEGQVREGFYQLSNITTTQSFPKVLMCKRG